MSSIAQRIAGIAQDARDARLAPEDAIERLAEVAQARGGQVGRRADGAFFTDHDVARHLARRAIVGTLLDHAANVEDVDALLASGVDLHVELGRAARDERARSAMCDRLATLRVLDPTCGAGSFLLAAWIELLAAERLLDVTVVRLDQLHGVDVDADAVAACQATLAIAGDGHPGEPHVTCADAEGAGALPDADILLGNPPFVRTVADDRHAGLVTATVPNRSAWIVERALDVALPGARVGFVLPISTACTDAFAPARACWERACDRVHATHFDTIPSSLFQGVVQRLSCFEGRARIVGDAQPARWWTSRYHRWLSDERGTLLDRISHVPLPPQSVDGSLAKVGTTIECRLLDRMFVHEPAGRHFRSPDSTGSNRIHYKRRWSYFLLFTDFIPGIWDDVGTPRSPSELKSIDVDPALDARVLLAVFSSTLFWWYFSVFTDNRNVNRRDLAAFPLPDLDSATSLHLAQLGGELMEALHACAEVRTCTYRSIGTIRNTYFRQGATRPILDHIDRVLAGAYGMDDSELEFVLGFERRFRS